MATRKTVKKATKPATPVIEAQAEASIDTARADNKLLTRLDQLGGQVQSIRAHYADASEDARYAAAIRIRSIANTLFELTK